MKRSHLILLIQAAGMLMLSSCSKQPVHKASSSSPQSLEVLEKSIEDLHSFVLENGMVCLLKQDSSAPVAAIQIWVGSGAIHEDEYLGSGIAHAMEHMIFKGTKTMAPGDITRIINDAGGKINAYTGHDRTVFVVDIPARNWKTGLQVLADSMMNATFPAEEWAKEKEVILREYAMGRDDPERVIAELQNRTSFTIHPYRYPVIGYEEIFRQIDREDLSIFYSKNYVPDNMITVIAGDIDIAEVEKAVRDAFTDFKRRARAPVIIPQEPAQTTPRFARKTGPYNTLRMIWSYHTVDLAHPDAPALDILNAIVGNGNSSRLNQNIQEKQKLVNRIYSWSYTPKDPGEFGIGISMMPENEEKVIEALHREIAGWLTIPFTAEEIEKARRSILVSELSSLQTMEGQANNFASGQFYASDPGFSLKFLEKLKSVTAEDLNRVVRKYLREENRTTVILAPEAGKEEAGRIKTGSKPPEPQKETLSNGIPLIVREDHRLPFVYVTAALKAGLLTEGEQAVGITLLMSEMTVRGTAGFTAEQVAWKTDSIGADITPFSGYNSFGIRGRCLSSDIESFLEIFSECLTTPSFPEDQLEIQRNIQLSQIAEQKEDPFFLAETALKEMMFPGHPYRWNITGEEGTVSKISREDLVAYFNNTVTAGNIVISIFGDITMPEAKNIAEKYFGNMRKKALEIKTTPAAPSLPARAKRRSDNQQTIILMGFPGLSVDDKNADTATLLQNMLSGLSSKLGIDVREKRGLVYYIGAYNQLGIDPGMFVLYAGTREDAVAEVEELMNTEIKRLATEGPSSEELERARKRVIAGFEINLQDHSEIATTCALNELYGLGHMHVFKTEERFGSITAEDVRRTAASILSTNRVAVSLLLPEEKKETPDTPAPEMP